MDDIRKANAVIFDCEAALRAMRKSGIETTGMLVEKALKAIEDYQHKESGNVTDK